jgi:hypothetical protein
MEVSKAAQPNAEGLVSDTRFQPEDFELQVEKKLFNRR